MNRLAPREDDDVSAAIKDIHTGEGIDIRLASLAPGCGGMAMVPR